MPKAKLTKSVIDTIPLAVKGQTIYWDTEMPGYGLIVGRNSRTFIAQKDIKGHSVRSTIGRFGHFTADEARKIAKDRLYNMALGVNPNDDADESAAQLITLEAVLESYLKAKRDMKPNSRAAYRDALLRYMDDWRLRPIAEIDKRMVASRHARIAENHSTYAANKSMRILRALFNYANATFDVCPANPVLYLTHVKAWYKEKRRRSYIKPSDLAGWWKGVQGLDNKTYRDFLLLLVFTGLRRKEAASLRWENVDLTNKHLTVVDTKNSDPLTLPLSPYVHSLLTTRLTESSDSKYVFPGRGKGGYLAEPKKGIQKVISATGISFTCHDLRRTFITIAEGLDIGGYALKRLINHRVTDVTDGYIMSDVERLRAPTEKVEKFILEKVDADKKPRNREIDKAKTR